MSAPFKRHYATARSGNAGASGMRMALDCARSVYEAVDRRMPEAAAPPKPKPPENPVERRVLDTAIRSKCPVRFHHNDGTVTEGIVIALDRYTIALEGDVLLYKHGVKLAQLTE